MMFFIPPALDQCHELRHRWFEDPPIATAFRAATLNLLEFLRISPTSCSVSSSEAIIFVTFWSTSSFATNHAAVLRRSEATLKRKPDFPHLRDVVVVRSLVCVSRPPEYRHFTHDALDGGVLPAVRQERGHGTVRDHGRLRRPQHQGSAVSRSFHELREHGFAFSLHRRLAHGTLDGVRPDHP